MNRPKNRRIRKRADTEFRKGFICQQRGESAKDPAEKQVWYDKAIGHYAKAIVLNPADAEVYYNRGSAYTEKGELDTAIQDFSTAIDLKPENAVAYINRVWVWLLLNEWENAKADLTTAKNIGFDIVTDFHNAYGSVADFEAGLGVKVPADIAALLRGD